MNDEYGEAVIEAKRQRELLTANKVKSTADWHLYQSAIRKLERLERQRDAGPRH